MKTGEKIDTSIRLDSIMILEDTIFKSNQSYYLILKNKRGQKIMEGDFFDQYSNGKIIEYHYNGNKKFEGTYKLVKLEKGKKVCKSGKQKILVYWESERVGEWKFYDLSGKLVDTKNYP